MKKIKLLFFVALMLFCMTACGANDKPTSVENPSTSDGSQTSSKPPSSVVSISICADFTAGNPDVETHGLVKNKTIEIDSEPVIEDLADALSEWTGLDFSLIGAHIEGNNAYVDWSVNSTLVHGLDGREQKEDFYFFDAVSLNWFMMDSLSRTIKENLPVETVYYSMEGGDELVFPNPEDMAAQGLPSLPTDQPYEGSAFFMAHAEGKGDETEVDDLPYWNGMDFGPNLEYYEEYQLQGDPGEYLNAAEGAKLTFDIMRENGNIPGEYSDDTHYTMVLIGLEEIESEECYIYRLEVDEPTGTIGAAYAYAYQSGNIYMQGYGSQWVII